MRKRRLGVADAASLVVGALFASTFCAAPLPEPAPFAGPIPSASPPAEMSAYRLPTA